MNDPFVSNLLIFARLLRQAGMAVSAEQVSDLARILSIIGIARREDVYYAARALFVRRHADQALFDRAFDLFFHALKRPAQSVLDPTQSPAHRALRPKSIHQLAERETRREENPSPDHAPTEADQRMTYSPLETLARQKHFEQFTPDELYAARQRMAAMQWEIGSRVSHRRERTRRRKQIDLANLVRRNLKYGSEFFNLPMRQPKLKPRPLIMLADISGSMERYTRWVLYFLHALSHQTAAPTQVFLFGTRLTYITPDLKRRNVDDALARVVQHVPDWSGGTRIGEAIKTFNFKWARRVLRSEAVVLILSDGWDCGNLELLGVEVARLQRSCSRLIWLSPLLGDISETAVTQGLQVALPFVDDFLPVYNLAGLDMLIAKLKALDQTRPLRRQHQVRLPAPVLTAPTQVMDAPQMGTSNYVRRTMTLRFINGTLQFQYEENPA